MEIAEMNRVCFGTWQQVSDKKGRIGIPSKCRAAFRDRAIIIENDDLTFSVYPLEKVENVSDYSKTMTIKLDWIGRFSIPAVMRRRMFPGQKGQRYKVTLYGKRDHFDIELQC